MGPWQSLALVTCSQSRGCSGLRKRELKFTAKSEAAAGPSWPPLWVQRESENLQMMQHMQWRKEVVIHSERIPDSNVPLPLRGYVAEHIA